MGCDLSSIKLITFAALILSCFCTTIIYCQELSGSVVDEQQHPLHYVTTLLKVEDSVINVAITDSLGRYTFRGIHLKFFSFLFSIHLL